MKYIRFLLIGVLFGINMSQSGFASWQAWQDMFLFRSWQLYGVMFTAIVTGMLGLQLIRRFNIRGSDGQPIVIAPKNRSFHRYAWGGLIFGIGWTIAGCPGTTYTLLGHGYASVALVLTGALSGTLVYGLVRKYLPH